MKKVYVSIGYDIRKRKAQEVQVIKEFLSRRGYRPMVFVDEYRFADDEEQEMMDRAFQEIDESEFVIAEVSEKAIGVGIEVGYALGKGKRVLYLKDHSSPYSKTVGGSAQDFIAYASPEELASQLELYSG